MKQPQLYYPDVYIYLDAAPSRKRFNKEKLSLDPSSLSAQIRAAVRVLTCNNAHVIKPLGNFRARVVFEPGLVGFKIFAHLAFENCF